MKAERRTEVIPTDQGQFTLVSIIIPIYNENQNIVPLYGKLRQVSADMGCPFEIIFVNDGSRDGSHLVLDELAERDPHIKVIHFRRNFGQTAAIMAGIDFSRGDVIVPIDGDLQNDPQDIPKLLDKLRQGYDVCSGWRKDRKDSAIRRNLPSRLANRIISQISGVHLKDYGCTLKAYRREVLQGVKLYGEMHRFVPIYASWQGAKVTEVAVSHHLRVHGESKYGLDRTFKVVLDLLVVKFLGAYAQKPIYVFGLVGLLNYLLGFLAGSFALYLKFFRNTTFIQTPLPLIVVMTIVTGTMCLLMGLLAEMIVRTYHESQNKPVYLVGASRNLEQDC